jgi:hypothetical protein
MGTPASITVCRHIAWRLATVRCGRERKTTGQAVASGSRDDLEALVIGSHSDGLNQPVVLDGLGKLVQLGFIEGAAGVGGGFVNLVDGEKPGMVLAIEPMINLGSAEVKVLEDGWTAITVDGSVSAHFEHTVAITKDGPAS